MNRQIQSAAFALVAAATVHISTISAQLGSYNPPPGPQGTFVIKNAKVFPVSGPMIPNGTVVISGGKITAVGPSASSPGGATVIDGAGLSVYPGMIESRTTIGLLEIEEGATSMQDNEDVGRFMPNLQAIFGIDPHSAHIGVSRVVGITSVVTRPSGGIISGQAAFINLAGYTAPSMAVVPRVAMVIALPGTGGGRGGGGGGGFPGGGRGGRGGAAAPETGGATPTDSLKQLFRDADLYGKVHDQYKKNPAGMPRPKDDVVLASMVPLVRGEQPALFTADAAAEIRTVIAFCNEMKIKGIIIGGRDALKVADLLKANNVPIIYSHTMDVPTRADDYYDANYSMPAKLAAAGIKFAISSGEPNPDIRNLPYVAGMASAFGLSKADALKAVTLWPAQAWGLGDKLGSIEVGKMANIVVTSGDMLEASSDTKYLFIDGRMVPLATKHSDLYNQFKDRKGGN